MRTTTPRAGPLQQYGIAVLAALIAFGASYATWPFSKTMPWVFFFTAVTVSAWFGGQGPSLLATGLLVLFGRYFFMKPYGAFSLDVDSAAQILIFVGVSLFIGSLVSARRRAEARERAEHRWFQATMKSIGDAVLATDAAGRIIFMNGIAEGLTGWSAADAVGREIGEVYAIVSEENATQTKLVPSSKVMEDSRVLRRAENQVLKARDGTSRPVDESAGPIKDDRGQTTGMVLVFRDVSARKEAEKVRTQVQEATRKRAEQLQKLAEIATRINRAYDAKSVIGIVTAEARTLIEARQSAIGIVLPKQQDRPFQFVSTAPASNSPLQPTAPDFDAIEFHEAMKAAEQPVRLRQDELPRDRAWTSLKKIALALPTANGWLAVPIVDRTGTRMGLIQLADKKEGLFTDDDEAILVQLSRLAAIAIENATLYDELKANDQRKDEFLAMLAHELRNPLAAIANAVSVTRQTGQKEHLEWSIDVIARQMNHLTRLIDDLLDVSRINRGKIELRKTVLDATPILESAAATVRPLVDERKHTLAVAIERGGLWVNADPTRLEQIVVNLLNNAARYSHNEGHIDLLAHNNGKDVVIGVRDRGIGIPPEKLPGMFELFAQGDRSLARSEGGLGIGLTVVKKLVEMHGGSVTARSEGNDRGSEFTIRLPAAARPAASQVKDQRLTGSTNRRARILVVDDNVDTAHGMARLLALIGHETATAYDGNEALDLARRFKPEFVLLDIGLPGMDGYEVASRMRQEPWCKDTMIVAVSGYGQDEDRRRSTEAGFDHHLIKPLDHDALLSLIAPAGSGAR